MINVAVVDDHKLFRKTFEILLNQIPNIHVVFQGCNGLELLQKLENTNIDLVFLDLQMPIMDGFQTATRLNRDYPKIKIIILSMLRDSFPIQRVLKSHICGYLTKNVNFKELKKALKVVINGGYYYQNDIRELVTALNTNTQNTEILLTEREIEVVRLYALQYSGKQIADQLAISLRTVEKHKENLMLKVQTKNFIGVIIFALSKHYLMIEEIQEDYPSN